MDKAIIATIKDETQEIIQLVESLNYTINDIFKQKRKNPDTNSYFGAGKIDDNGQKNDQTQIVVDLFLEQQP